MGRLCVRGEGEDGGVSVMVGGMVVGWVATFRHYFPNICVKTHGQALASTTLGLGIKSDP